MSYSVTDAVDGIRRSRASFLKHLTGLKEDQWEWKVNVECKSIRETLAHLICDDRAALQALETGKEPDYASIEEPETDCARLLALLDESHRALCDTIVNRWKDAPLETVVSIWGFQMSLGAGLADLSSEDHYHAGQVAYIRNATDPTWDYYGIVYGIVT